MDNDDLRHGKPTNHKVYGDAIATLAGDALVTDAFAVVARSPFAKKHPEVVLEVIAELSDAAGSGGMVSGQVIDILGEGRTMNLEQLEYLHSKKTGAMFLASVVGGARLGGATSLQLDSLSKYARALGLCFQVVDDLLDVEASTEQMGKRTNKDQAAGKNTYPVLMGIEQSRAARARSGKPRAGRAVVIRPSRRAAARDREFRGGAKALSAQPAIAKSRDHAHSRQAFLVKPRELVLRDVDAASSGAGRGADPGQMRAQLRHRFESVSPRPSDVADADAVRSRIFRHRGRGGRGRRQLQSWRRADGRADRAVRNLFLLPARAGKSLRAGDG